ncbi:hypothetical protein TELCIR_21279, partial [Teladorsagia circumcincta]
LGPFTTQVYHCDAEKVAERLLLDNQAESHPVTSDFKYFVNYYGRLFEQWIRKPSGPNCIRDSDCDQFGRYLICLGRYGLCMDQPTRVYSYPFKKYLK